jgi:hypothetical protein
MMTEDEMRKSIRQGMGGIFTMLAIKWVIIIGTTRIARKLLEKK